MEKLNLEWKKVRPYFSFSLSYICLNSIFDTFSFYEKLNLEWKKS